MENWKDVYGYEGLYQVSDLGNVRTLAHVTNGKPVKERIRKQTKNVRNGYMTIGLSKNGKSSNVYVHRLVATAFVDNPDGKPTVNHKNEDKTDNRAENLEWMTLPENLAFGTHDERAKANHKDMHGDLHPNFGRRGSEALTHKGSVVGIKKDDPTVVVRFDTAATASRVLGISSGHLCDTLKGKYKSCGGYYWRRLDE